MRMAIMGGTLDPVHNGHLQIAKAVKEACGLDGVMLLPAGDPPHKQRASDRFDRLEMARRAAAGADWIEVSDIEVLREGTTYTVDTLTELRRRRPDVEWIYIIGADTVNVVDKWRDFPRVAAMCAFAAVERPGFDEAGVRERADMLRSRYGARIEFPGVTGPDISSTMVRERIAEGLRADDLLPEGVEAYILEKGLYRCAYAREDLEKKLSGMLKPSRFRHTLGVAETAMRLAARYGVDGQKAWLAGMLHDCAKSMDEDEMLRLIRAEVPDADADELSIPPVLHAPAGSVLARREFGVRDPEILNAIRNHTLGGPGMTELARLIYLSDFIEPNRKPFDGLEEVRALAETNLHAAIRRSVQLTNEYIGKREEQTHRRTLQMLNELT